VFFDSGKAELKPESLALLDALQFILADNQEILSMIRVEGHTDNLPIHTAQFPSNWELSSARANNVLRYILEQPPFVLNAQKLNTSGYGEWHPIASNDTADGRLLNRRVDFVVEGYRERQLINADEIGTNTSGRNNVGGNN
jgi:chemotaxis protein MotB